MSTWSRLRWPIKAVIIAVPLLGLLWLANNQGWLSPNGPNSYENTNTGSNSSNTADADRDDRAKDNDNQTSSGNNADDHRDFAYEPEKPVNPKMRGVVEVGSTGFNSFVINMDAQRRWEIVTKDFGESLVYEGLATTDDIRAGLKKYLSKMFDQGVTKNNMHFVISSGAQKEGKTAGIVSELKKMGYVVNLVTPDQEGKLALKSVQPPSYQNNSFVVDIGSGNTKISWYEGASLKTLELPGAKYFEKGTPDATVDAEVRQKVASIPKDKREVCFIIGGAPFELASMTRPKGSEDRYTVLRNAGSYNDPKMKAKTKSGLVIYKAIAEATGCDTFVFDWNANFTIGFLLGLPV